MAREKKDLTYPELVQFVNSKIKEQDRKIAALYEQLHKEELSIIQLWRKVYGGIKKRP